MAGDIEIFDQLKPDPYIQGIIQHLPLYAGMFDPHAYIECELKVDAKFDKYDLSEHQMTFVASSVLADYALTTWKHICRKNKAPQTWKGFKMLFMMNMFLNIMLMVCLQN
jgi:hypothetical protein